MATLVLTAVGSLFGGPIGGLIGSVVGQQIDQNVLFRPEGRTGPRLMELEVQTSSYGTQIPRIYGTMRSAGSVIWATDLKEERERQGGGKGRPRTTTFRYSGCFAVAISSRPIAGVGRIWADGNLLRGEAGDFKVDTEFRLYNGHDNQDIDPLIAASQAQDIPAFRGMAYAVFENLDLTEYGNRIPSLTFEVIAENQPVVLDQITDDLTDGRVRGEYARPIVGFAASGNDQRAVLETISQNIPLGFQLDGDKISFSSRLSRPQPRALVPTDPVIAINDEQTEAESFQAMPITATPRQIALRYNDPSRDYLIGLQNAFRPAPGDKVTRLDFPATLSSNTARILSEENLWATYFERSSATLHVRRGVENIGPGTTIELTDRAGHVMDWRVREWEMKDGAIELRLTALPQAIGILAQQSEAGQIVNPADQTSGTTILELVDLPFLLESLLRPSNRPAMVAVASSADAAWRPAPLFRSDIGGQAMVPLGSSAPAAIMGRTQTSLEPATAQLRDNRNHVDVMLFNETMQLADADPAGLINGRNLAMIGDEIVQFSRAEPIAETSASLSPVANRYRLSGLLRGLGGTESEITRHETGDRFILLDSDSLQTIDVPNDSAAQSLEIMALGRGDSEPVSARSRYAGRAITPWSPVHGRTERRVDGAIELRWTRRSRAGLAWPDHVETPLAEEQERYRLILADPEQTTTLLEEDVDQPQYTLSAVLLEMFRDNGITAMSASIQQVGTHRLSLPLTLSIPL